LHYSKDCDGENFQYLGQDTQTESGRMFEQLANLTDEDSALAGMQDMGLLN